MDVRLVFQEPTGALGVSRMLEGLVRCPFPLASSANVRPFSKAFAAAAAKQAGARWHKRLV